MTKLTKVQKALKENAPHIDDDALETLRLMSVMKKAVENELIEGATGKEVVLDVRRIADAHIQSIAYWMCMSSIMDDHDSMISSAMEVAVKLLNELPQARAAWKQSVANHGIPAHVQIIDENLMEDKSVTNPARTN
jgi:hypothetical protein